MQHELLKDFDSPFYYNVNLYPEFEVMTNEERWCTFITELREYIEEHHLGPSRHTDLYNQLHYFRKKMKAGTLEAEKAKELDEVLSTRDLNLHTGGRKKKHNNSDSI